MAPSTYLMTARPATAIRLRALSARRESDVQNGAPPSSRRSPGRIAGHRLAPSEWSSGASSPRPEGVLLRARRSRSSVTLIEYRSGPISLLSFDARLAFVGPSSNDCRCRSHRSPKSLPVCSSVVIQPDRRSSASTAMLDYTRRAWGGSLDGPGVQPKGVQAVII